jgi:hypothetical protein
MVVVLSRGRFCPKDRRQAEQYGAYLLHRPRYRMTWLSVLKTRFTFGRTRLDCRVQCLMYRILQGCGCLLEARRSVGVDRPNERKS